MFPISNRTAARPLFVATLTTAVMALSACGESGTATEPTASAARGGNTGSAAGATGSTNGSTNGSTSGSTGGTTNGATSGTTTNTVASRCNGTIGAITVDDVFVPTGASCTLNGTRVRGNVKVSFDGSVSAAAARIDGSIQAEDARAVMTAGGTAIAGDVEVKRRAAARLENTTIAGNLKVEETGASVTAADLRITGDIQVSKAATADLTRVIVTGDVQLVENLGALRSTQVTVEGNMQIEKNLGGVTLLNNRVRQVLECKENVPAPIGSGNVTGEKKEQCRAL